MKGLEGGSVRRRLVLVSVAASMLALCVGCAVLLWLERGVGYDRFEAEVETLTELVAYEAAVPLERHDVAGASEILRALQSRSDIRCGVLFDHEDVPFAVYRASEVAPEVCDIAPSPVGVHPAASAFHVSRSVELHGEWLGTFTAVASLDAVRAAMIEKAAICLAVTLACGLLAFLLAWHGTSTVTRSIRALVRLASDVAASQDYARRAPTCETDEIAALGRALNQMLACIEGDKDLSAQRERLRDINSMLALEKERALAAVRAKSEFLANMSHEIRTPMTAILGYVELLRNGEVEPEEVQRVLEVIRRNGQHLISVINDILDISKLESGQLRVEAISTSLIEMIRDVENLMRERAVEKGVVFEVRYESRVPSAFVSDPTRLRQIMLNLVSNAIKFTSAGFVRIWVSKRERAQFAGECWLSLRVEDTGTGIPEEKQDAVFQAFSQADSSTTRRFGGSGLGLSISKTLAQLLGGELRLVRSRVGEGSIFELELPLRSVEGTLDWVDPLAERARSLAASEVSRQPVYPSGLSGRVLLAEDSIDTQRLVKVFLVRAGLTLDVAENGRVAYECARRAREAGEPYDLILMDMQMPDIDGYTATTMLRAEGHAEPILAFTAHAMMGERERCIAAGCDDFVTKPIDRASLLRTIQSYLK